jgi:hypothetical protein
VSGVDCQLSLSPEVWKPEVVSALAQRQDGSAILNVYLRLAWMGADNPKVGPILIPASVKQLAARTGFSQAQIRETLKVFSKLGMVKKAEEACLSAEHAPSLAEIEAYVEEKKLKVNPRRFYAYYAPSGFTYLGGLMNWRAKLAEWSRTERPKKNRLVTAKDYYAQQQPVNTKDLDKAMKAL